MESNVIVAEAGKRDKSAWCRAATALNIFLDILELVATFLQTPRTTPMVVNCDGHVVDPRGIPTAQKTARYLTCRSGINMNYAIGLYVVTGSRSCVETDRRDLAEPDSCYVE